MVVKVGIEFGYRIFDWYYLTGIIRTYIIIHDQLVFLFNVTDTIVSSFLVVKIVLFEYVFLESRKRTGILKAGELNMSESMPVLMTLSRY